MQNSKFSLYFSLFFFCLFSFSCSTKPKKPDVNPKTELGRLVYHQLPNFSIENFTENEDYAQSLYVNSQQHLFLTIRAQKSPFDYLKKLNDEYPERRRISLAGSSLYEGVYQTHFNVSYLLVFEKEGLVFEIYFRTSQGYLRPLPEIKKLAREIALKILQS